MFTTIAFSESQDLGGVEGNVAGVPDQHKRVEGDQVFVDSFNKLVGAYACAGASATFCRIISPSLRRVNPIMISPLELALTAAANPVVDADPSRAVDLEINEGIEVLLTSNPAAAEQASVVLFMADREITPVKGKIYPVRFQVTVALVAGAFAYAQIDFIDELPVGSYKVVGGHMVVANGVIFRFVPVGGLNRPGAPTVPDEDNDAQKLFRFGAWGEWFTFSTIQPPGVEILSSAAAASATYEGIMDVML